MFRKAERSQSRLRMALVGPSGSGKTYTALRIAQSLGNKIALIDTERGSAEKYAGDDPGSFDFFVCPLEDDFTPSKYVAAIKEAETEGFDVLIVDSLSHAWSGKGGALEMVNAANTRQKSGNTWAAWREVTPAHNALVDAILQSKMHIICTMRTKTEWIIDDSSGKKTPKKIGLAPIQRDGIDYEFDVVGDLDANHNLIIEKTRCAELDNKVFNKPGDDVGSVLKRWLEIGVAEPKPKFSKPAEPKNPIEPSYTEGAGSAGVSSLLTGQVLPWLRSIGTSEEKINAVFANCAAHFAVKSLSDVPDERVEELRSYIKNTAIPGVLK
jgi:hypothetical protein